MESLFAYWYNFIVQCFDTTGITLTTESQSFINLVVILSAIFGVILSFAIIYNIIRFIFFTIFRGGR